MIKNKTKNDTWNYYVEYFIMESIYNNYLKVIHCLNNLNEVYETDFNLSQMGTVGLEKIICGLYFVYFCLKIILNLDSTNKFLNITKKSIDELVGEWSQVRNIPCDKFINNKNIYEKSIQQYILTSKNQLSQGYN
jgi:hypothetical protein